MKHSITARHSNFLHVFGIPIVIAVISIFGLISALVGEGMWDVLSWITLGIPTLIIVYFVWFGNKKNINKQEGKLKNQ